MLLLTCFVRCFKVTNLLSQCLHRKSPLVDCVSWSVSQDVNFTASEQFDDILVMFRGYVHIVPYVVYAYL